MKVVTKRLLFQMVDAADDCLQLSSDLWLLIIVCSDKVLRTDLDELL